ncbi:mycofactocin precursor MftA [Nocardioides ochotonae]|nr:mycofactocin precursor MftA [Nocardioides ochotonae]
MTPQASTDTTDVTADPTQTEESLTAESLIEEVSIDGMCGVY